MKPNIKAIKLYTIGMFTRIGNKSLFFSIDDDHINLIESEVKPGHKVHIFDLCEVSLIRNLNKFINSTLYNTKIYIHIPKTHMHLKDIVESIVDETNCPNVRIITERFGPVFTIKHNNKHHALFSVNYTDEGIVTRIELDCYKVNYKNISIFDSKYKNEILSIADELVGEFKKSCPPEILKSFKNDKEILEYMIEVCDVSISVKEEND